jgi:hypothetical protein
MPTDDDHALAAKPVAGRRAPFRRKPLFEALEQRLLMSASVVGAIDVPGETDTYQFSLPQAKLLYLDTQSNVNFSWSLSGPSGTVVDGRSFQGSNANEIGVNPVMNLPAGDYRLSVDAPGDATGPYAFQLLDLSQGQAITPGAAVSGTLNAGVSIRRAGGQSLLLRHAVDHRRRRAVAADQSLRRRTLVAVDQHRRRCADASGGRELLASGRRRPRQRRGHQLPIQRAAGYG